MARESSPLAILLDPKTDIPLGERDIRLEDYLNDKIQTSTDFESLESLLANVEAQKQQLEEQVGDYPRQSIPSLTQLNVILARRRQTKTLECQKHCYESDDVDAPADTRV
jgi:hypothetical protein